MQLVFETIPYWIVSNIPTKNALRRERVHLLFVLIAWLYNNERVENYFNKYLCGHLPTAEQSLLSWMRRNLEESMWYYLIVIEVVVYSFYIYVYICTHGAFESQLTTAHENFIFIFLLMHGIPTAQHIHIHNSKKIANYSFSLIQIRFPVLQFPSTRLRLTNPLVNCVVSRWKHDKHD
jgi:short subunit fatty acids transporter